MRIKNTHELVLRARGHARLDHVAQQTYGNAFSNGKVTFEGCFIGCLSTPHRQKELRTWYENLIENEGGYYDSQHEMIERLEEQFGIVPELARVAESVFESLPFHGGAIEFIPALAAALVEGSEITADDVVEWWEGFGGYVDETSASGSAHRSYEARDALLEWVAARPVAEKAVA